MLQGCVIDRSLDNLLSEIDTARNDENKNTLGAFLGTNSNAMEICLSNGLFLKGQFLCEVKHVGTLCSGR